MSQQNNFKPGTVITCINSKSPAYTKDENYTVVEHEKVRGLFGNDGLFDPLSMLCSFFKPADATTQALSKLKVVK